MIRDLTQRLTGFVPDWQNPTEEDPGVALVRLFGQQLAPVLDRLERLPEKAFVAFLDAAGISLGAARPASAMLVFTAAPAATASVLVQEGFQVGSAPADESDRQVIWETEHSIHVTPATIAAGYAWAGGVAQRLLVEGPGAFQPFGAEPVENDALILGVDGPISPGPTVSIGIEVAPIAGMPTPVADSVVEATPRGAAALLRWEILIGGRYRPLELLADDTAGLVRSGTVRMRVPAGWTPEIATWANETSTLRWLRLRLVRGGFRSPPTLISIRLNMVRATAARTIRNEFAVPVGGITAATLPLVYRLSQTPVFSGSLELEVEEGRRRSDLFALPGSSAESDGGAASFRRWEEVGSLAGVGPDARVYVLDPSSGEIRFGDGRNGRRPPRGVRNIVARRYRVGGGRAGAVAVNEITALVNTLPFLAGVTNPRPAAGGTDIETLASARRRGPHQLKARGRAVSSQDYAVLAVEAPGTDVARAFAAANYDPLHPGTAAPGVVGIFVIPARPEVGPADGPLVPSEETLGNVVAHLTRRVGPLGARFVAASPRYHSVGIIVTLEVDPGADVGQAVAAVIEALNGYLSPLIGGDDGGGWPFGGRLRFAALIRRVMAASSSVASVPSLIPVVDGYQYPGCQDVALSPYGLAWPAVHQVIPVPFTGDRS
ncbi:MAG: putative baseplate assembly protein [Rhodospirillales bacterium]